jgi:hypothetical protein
MLLGVTTLLGAGLIYRATHKPIPARILTEARALSVDPTQLADLSQLDAKLFAKAPLTAEEWARYKAYATGPNLVFKRKLARHLNAAMGSAHEQEARSLVKELIADPDPETRACALISLRKFADPSWKDVAQKFLSEPSETPREMAASLLEGDRQKR